MAVIDAMGLLDDRRPFVHESMHRHDVQRAGGGADDGRRVSGDRS